MSTDLTQGGSDALMQSFLNIGEHVTDIRNTAEDLESVIKGCIEFLMEENQIADMATATINSLSYLLAQMSVPSFFDDLADTMDSAMSAVTDQLPDLNIDFAEFSLSPITDVINGLLPDDVLIPAVDEIVQVFSLFKFSMETTELVDPDDLGSGDADVESDDVEAASASDDSASASDLVNPITYMLEQVLTTAQQGALEGVSSFFDTVQYLVDASGIPSMLQDSITGFMDAMTAAAGSFDLGLIASHFKIIASEVASAAFDIISQVAELAITPIKVILEILDVIMKSANDAFQSFFKLLPIDQSYIPDLSTIPMLVIAMPYTLIYKIVTGEAPPRFGPSAAQDVTMFGKQGNEDTVIFGSIAIATNVYDLIPVAYSLWTSADLDFDDSWWSYLLNMLMSSIGWIITTVEQLRQWNGANSNFAPDNTWTWDTIRGVFLDFFPWAWSLMSALPTSKHSRWFQELSPKVDFGFSVFDIFSSLSAVIYHFNDYGTKRAKNPPEVIPIQSFDAVDALFGFSGSVFGFLGAWQRRFGFLPYGNVYIKEDANLIANQDMLQVTIQFTPRSDAKTQYRVKLESGKENSQFALNNAPTWEGEVGDSYSFIGDIGSGTQTVPIDVTFAQQLAADEFIVLTVDQPMYDGDGDPFSKNCVSESLIISLAPPNIEDVSMSSSNSNHQYAKAGDTVTLEFSTSKPVETDLTVTIGSASATATDVGHATKRRHWSATYTGVNANHAEGPLEFSIICNDQGQVVDQVTAVTRGSAVTVDHTVPTLSNVSLTQTAETVTLDFTASESIQTPTVKFSTTVGGAPHLSATQINTSSVTGKTQWTAIYQAPDDVTEITISGFRIEFRDLAGNQGVPVTQTT